MGELDALFASSDPSDLSSAISQAGKRGLEEYRDRVASFLEHEDPELREAAIWTLAFHWRLSAFEQQARAMGYSDPDDLVRARAITAWARFHDGTNDPKLLREMVSILLDSAASRSARASAFGAVLTISGFPATRYSDQMKDTHRDVEKNVDWALVRDLLVAAGVEPPLALEERLTPK